VVYSNILSCGSLDANTTVTTIRDCKSSKQHVTVYCCIPLEDGLKIETCSDGNDRGGGWRGLLRWRYRNEINYLILKHLWGEILTGHFEQRWNITPCQFLIWLILLSWRWRQHVPPKHRSNFKRLHGITSHKTELFFSNHLPGFTLIVVFYFYISAYFPYF
jgi:hypothetical protein